MKDWEKVLKEVIKRVFTGLSYRVYLFGSRARGEETEGSDYDIAIWCEEEAKERFTQLRYLLEEEINIPYTVDVIDLKRASPAFKKMVLKEAKRWI